MLSIISVKPLRDFRLEVAFDNGEHYEVDMSPFIGRGISAALKGKAFFQKVVATDGFITWPNGFDFCPEALYTYATEKHAEVIV